MTSPNDIILGFVPIARTTFDIPLATQMTAQARAALENAGYTLVGPDGLVTNLDEASAAGDMLASEAPDLLIIFQATFADTTMVNAIVEASHVPVLLWGVPEERTGGRLRLNSLCGINLAAHSLKRAKYPYEYVYAAPDASEALRKVDGMGRAGRAWRLLQGARIGRVGQAPGGFDTCLVNEDKLAQQFNVGIFQIDLQSEVFVRARRAPYHAVETLYDNLTTRVEGLDQLDAESTRGTLGVYSTLREIAHHQKLDGLAVRCWPEFFTELGCAACGALSLLSDEQIPCSCEADVNGTLTQLILQWISAEPAFGSDIVAADDEHDGLVLWHCGLAPLSMADSDTRPLGTIHSNRKLPLLMEFPLKPGRVTLARLSEATGSYRLVIGSGDMQRAPKSFAGTSGVVRFDRPAEVILDTIISEGLEHHISLTYGDHVDALLSFARMLDLPVLRL